jgi:hypothetical protein
MKKTIALFTLWTVFLAALQAAEPITDFEDLMRRLKKGEEVRMVIYYGKCRLISNNEVQEKSPEAIGGMEITTFEYFAPGSIGNKKAFVVTSASHFIENPIGSGFVFNYVKVKIFGDNRVKITAKYLNSQTHEEIMTENFFSAIGDAENKGAVWLYAD